MLARRVVLALALVLAGCAGVGNAGAPETVTPAPVPTDATRYPPGVGADRLSAPVVARAHADALAGTNYTVHIRQTVRTNGTVIRNTTHVRRVGVGGDRYSGRFRYRDEQYEWRSTTVGYWTNGTVVATRTGDPEGPVRLRWWSLNGSTFIPDPSQSERLRATVAAVDLAVVASDPDGVTLAGRGFDERDHHITPLAVTRTRNVSASMRLSQAGIIRTRRISYDARFRNESVRVIRRTRVTAVGATTVSQPSWVTNATEARYRG